MKIAYNNTNNDGDDDNNNNNDDDDNNNKTKFENHPRNTDSQKNGKQES